jgi:hypothetical protein
VIAFAGDNRGGADYVKLAPPQFLLHAKSLWKQTQSLNHCSIVSKPPRFSAACTLRQSNAGPVKGAFLHTAIFGGGSFALLSWNFGCVLM